MAESAQRCPQWGISALEVFGSRIKPFGSGIVYKMESCPPMTTKAKKAMKPKEWSANVLLVSNVSPSSASPLHPHPNPFLPFTLVFNLNLQESAGTNQATARGSRSHCPKRTPVVHSQTPGFDQVAEFVKGSGQQGFSVEDFNVSDKNGRTPCFLAAERNLHTVIEAMGELGVNVNLCSKDGTTPLLRAAQCGNSEAAAALLRAGARGELMNKKGDLPLRECVLKGRLECTEAMLKTGKLNVDITASEVSV